MFPFFSELQAEILATHLEGVQWRVTGRRHLTVCRSLLVHAPHGVYPGRPTADRASLELRGQVHLISRLSKDPHADGVMSNPSLIVGQGPFFVVELVKNLTRFLRQCSPENPGGCLPVASTCYDCLVSLLAASSGAPVELDTRIT